MTRVALDARGALARGGGGGRGGVDVHGVGAGGVGGSSTVHEAVVALAELVDGADGVDGSVQGAAGVEVLLDDGQQVGAARGAGAAGGLARDERVQERLVGGDAGAGVDGQAALDEVAGVEADAAPVLDRGEAVVGDEDGLHLLEVGVGSKGV
jgi:hypothetical protein